jgi:hypothetical protein
MALLAPLLWCGFFADDYFYLSRLRQTGSTGIFSTLLSIYRLVEPGQLTGITWWADPRLQLRLLRPLSAAFWVLDATLFGTNAFGYHVTNLVLWGALLAAAAALFRRLAPTPRAAQLAFAIYAWSDARALAVGWISNRTVLLSTICSLLGLIAWDEFRRRQSLLLAAAALAAFAIGLATGEYALSGFLLLAGYEWGRRGQHPRRLAPLVPFLLLGLTYVAVYRAGGFGSAHSAIYLDPSRDPGGWASAAVIRIPVLGAGLLYGLPIDLWGFMRPTQQMLAALASFILCWIAVGPLRLPVAKDPRVAGLALGAALSLVPVASTSPTARLLLLPGVGAALVLGVFLDSANETRSSDAAARAFVWLRHVVLAPLLLGIASWALLQALNADRRAGALVPTTSTVYVLGAPNLFSASSIASYALDAGRPPPRVALLSVSGYPARVRRDGPRALILELRCGRLFDAEFERFYSDAPPPLNAPRAGPGFVATIASERTVRFEFAQALEQLLFVRWSGGVYGALTPPSAGETLELDGVPQGLGPFSIPAVSCP